MEDRAPSLTTVHLNEGTLRLAESIAERYGISVGDMIDMLLLELVQRADHTRCRLRSAPPRASSISTRGGGGDSPREPDAGTESMGEGGRGDQTRPRGMRVGAKRALGRHTAAGAT